MSGELGCPEKIEQLLTKFFARQKRAGVGVHYKAGELYIVIVAGENGWQIKSAKKRTLGEEFSAERVAMLLKQELMVENEFAFCLDAERSDLGIFDLPTENIAEAKQAIHWEFFSPDSAEAPVAAAYAEDGNFWGAVLPDEATAWQKEWQEQGFSVRFCLLPPDYSAVALADFWRAERGEELADGWREALYAALVCLDAQAAAGLVFGEENKAAKWDLRRIALGIIGTAAVIVAAVLAMDFWQLEQAANRGEDYGAKLQALAEDNALRIDYEKRLAELRAKENSLVNLSKERNFAYGALAKISTLSMEGLRFIELDYVGNEIKLTGETVDYSLLTDFIAELEAGGEYRYAKLEGTKPALDSANKVIFTLTLGLRGL